MGLNIKSNLKYHSFLVSTKKHKKRRVVPLNKVIQILKRKKMGTNGHGRTLMSPEVLLRIYRRMKAEPLKIWVMKDFGLDTHRQQGYMGSLVALDLIERIDNLYVDSLKGRKKIKNGWRFKR